ncbi:MAG TPA: alkaline phosphatase PhoX [Flavisolibacter sp.]|nr:alkaline phosphatase PhoX [Flavisolibacter sp.]
MKNILQIGGLGLLTASLLAVPSCKKDGDNNNGNGVELKAHSITPSLVKAMPGAENLEFLPLISSEDKLSGSPNFIYGAQPDGGGLIKDPASNGYIMLTNHEILFSVSKVYLDNTFKPVKGEYVVDREGGGMRLCSATMATPEEHGFGPMFLTAGESSQESMVHGISPYALASDRKRNDRTLPALGKANMENAVPLPKDAYPGKTVVFIGEDQSYSASHQSAGQLLMYLNNIVGDLQTGELYALKRSNGDQVEMNMTRGNVYDVEFTKLPNIRTKTGAEINTIVNGLGAIRFSRVEDVDYRKGGGANGREIYFVATGQANNGGTTPETGYTMWGRMYKLVLNANDPTKGKLEVVAEGDSNPGNDLINPDNVCATENYVYIQEDGDSFYPASQHDSYIWQYNISNKQYKPWLTMNHNRTDATWNAKFNPLNVMFKGSWEYGAMYDVSDIIGVPNSFILNIHPHTWRSQSFKDADGSGLNLGSSDLAASASSVLEGGQTLIIRGVSK